MKYKVGELVLVCGYFGKPEIGMVSQIYNEKGHNAVGNLNKWHAYVVRFDTGHEDVFNEMSLEPLLNPNEVMKTIV